MANLEIQEDVGGTLSFEAPQAPISAATCSINDTDGPSLATPSVTLPLSTTFSETAAVGDTSISVASSAGLSVGDSLFISNDNTEPNAGQGEGVRIKNISTPSLIELYESIAFSYTTGHPVGSNILSISITAGNAATKAEGYEWRISYRVTGESADTKALVQWDVVRNPWPAKLLPTWERRKHLGEMGGAIMESVAHSGTDFEDDIEVATGILKDNIMERGYFPNRFRSLDEFKRPLSLLVMLIWARRGENIPKMWRDVPEVYLDARQIDYQSALNTALNVNRSYDSDDSGVVSTTEKDNKLGFFRMVR